MDDLGNEAANFDGILDGVMNIGGNGGIIGVIVVGILGLIFYFKFNKKTNKMLKEHKKDIKQVNQNKKEDLVKIKNMDEDIKKIVEDIKDNDVIEDEIIEDINNKIDDTVNNINENKLNPEKLKIKNTNDRLKKMLEKTRRRNSNNE